MYAHIEKINKPVPRYTSYPTAPEWEALQSGTYRAQLEKLAKDVTPLSLYFHIPFCKTMCLYCGCSVVLNRKEENEALYVDYLLKEMELVFSILGNKRRVTQLHFGGGTPTKLSIPLFSKLFEHLQKVFIIDFSKEVAIEIDPRTVYEDQGKKLRFLRELGFNRVSFGVQDTDPKVQEAVKRRQPLEMTIHTYEHARSLGFESINIDLIYGLPFQTQDTFAKTVQHILKMRPDRIALFSYAKVPWLKPHQKAIKEDTLPSTEEKFRIYEQARKTFIENGYVAIGMDHFALKEDEMAKSYYNKTLQRNFQGYTVERAEEMLSFGITAIGFVKGCYIQNIKELEAYYAALDRGELPIHRGRMLTAEDHLRKWVIHTLMCNFELDKSGFKERFGEDFDSHFKEAHRKLKALQEEGLLKLKPHKIEVTPIGELLIRLIASTFDAYLEKPMKEPKFSRAI